MAHTPPQKFTEQKMAHAPGPWKVIDLDGRIKPVRERKMPHGESSTFYAVVRCANGQSFKLDFGYGYDNDEANAHLIAAAPDLYEAARALVSAIERADLEHGQEVELAAVRAALAKASGAAGRGQ